MPIDNLATKVATGLALLNAIPISRSVQSSTGSEKRNVTGPSVRHAGVEYDNDGRTLRYCRVRHSSGDEDVDAAICGLMKLCVTGGATAPEETSACFKPKLARLAALVDAGLLQALPATPSDEGEPGDIVVTGRRVPPPAPGLWLFSEEGSRQQVAGGSYATLFQIVTLPARRWRLCIREAALEETLTSMLRSDPYDTKGSPCPWTVTAGNGRFAGKQRCTRPGVLIHGTLTGLQDNQRFAVVKEIRIRSLIVTSDTSPTSGATRPSGEGAMPTPGAPPETPVEYLERTSVEGHRSGSC